MLRRLLLIALICAGTGAAAKSGDGYKVCGLNPNGDNFLALRSGPTSSAQMVMKLGPGTVVESRGVRQGNWLAVVILQANGRTYLRNLPSGYVFTRYLCDL